MRFAVVGHTEWIEFVRVPHVPAPGEIVHADESWHEPAGGGAVAAVQLAKLAGAATFFTALGDDEIARRTAAKLRAWGLEILAATRNCPQRTGVAFLDAQGERTITVIGDRLVPCGEDNLPWERLAEMDGVYFTGGDPAALRAARAARILVATPRAHDALAGSGVTLDALVRSGSDASEQEAPGRGGWSAPLIVTTRGAEGGTYEGDGKSGSFEPAPLRGPIADAYGAGDSFAAGFTFGLGSGMALERALAVAAHCGAGVLTGAGPYAGQPTAADLAVALGPR